MAAVNRKHAKRAGGGRMGLVVLGAILAALAISTYVEAPSSRSDASEGPPAIHWGGR